MSETTNRGPIIQTPYAPSVVEVGDRIIGRDVTTGWCYTGDVAGITGPIKSPDCGGYRYKLTNTGQFYTNGNLSEPIVYAEAWHKPLTDTEIAAIPAGARVEALALWVGHKTADGSPPTRQITIELHRPPRLSGDWPTVGPVVRLTRASQGGMGTPFWDTFDVIPSSIRVLG